VHVTIEGRCPRGHELPAGGESLAASFRRLRLHQATSFQLVVLDFQPDSLPPVRLKVKNHDLKIMA
jgi:hypothetical protein